MNSYLELACQVVVIMFLATGSAAITRFYSFCIGDPHNEEVKPGRVFSWIGHWLDMKYTAFEKAQNIWQKQQVDILMNKRITGDQFIREEYKIKRRRKRNPYKPLGCCPICTNPYVSILVHTPVYIVFGLSWWFFVPGLAISGMINTHFTKKL